MMNLLQDKFWVLGILKDLVVGLDCIYRKFCQSQIYMTGCAGKILSQVIHIRKVIGVDGLSGWWHTFKVADLWWSRCFLMFRYTSCLLLIILHQTISPYKIRFWLHNFRWYWIECWWSSVLCIGDDHLSKTSDDATHSSKFYCFAVTLTNFYLFFYSRSKIKTITPAGTMSLRSRKNAGQFKEKNQTYSDRTSFKTAREEYKKRERQPHFM